MPILNLAHTLPRSAVNGPGDRFTVWAQGCPFACVGCWNPDTWAFVDRDVTSVDVLASRILSTAGIEGVTFTGGEPFAQAAAFAHLGRRVRAAGLSVFVFTGYERSALRSDAQRALLAVTDVLVTGRYVAARHAPDLPWRGSSNQQLHFLTERYGEEDIPRGNEYEVFIAPDGQVTMTGFPELEA